MGLCAISVARGLPREVREECGNRRPREPRRPPPRLKDRGHVPVQDSPWFPRHIHVGGAQAAQAIAIRWATTGLLGEFQLDAVRWRLNRLCRPPWGAHSYRPAGRPPKACVAIRLKPDAAGRELQPLLALAHAACPSVMRRKTR